MIKINWSGPLTESYNKEVNEEIWMGIKLYIERELPQCDEIIINILTDMAAIKTAKLLETDEFWKLPGDDKVKKIADIAIQVANNIPLLKKLKEQREAMNDK